MVLTSLKLFALGYWQYPRGREKRLLRLELVLYAQ